ncbi:MAG TPA: aspartate-alanine antiporter [Gaiellaceae bacterium]|jgi:putative transport protein|nr:aspartate-alanine antiporter [Gaiellaceae bacterium]
MAWLAMLFESHPELGVFLALGLGYLLGTVKVRGVGLGTVTGSLVAGLVIGYFFHVPVSDTAKSVLFLLFLFGIGYSVGPTFFKTMRGGGWRWAVLGIVTPIAGLLAAWGVARFLKLDVGFAAGLLSGSLTESPAIGTASEAIRALSLPDDLKQRLVSHIAVADAMCYVFGAFGVIWFCSVLAPRLLRIDLKQEAKRVEKEIGLERAKPGVVSGWSTFAMRAYRLASGMRSVGLCCADAEKQAPDGVRIFVERIRRDGAIIAATPDLVLRVGDIVAVSGRQDQIIQLIDAVATEVADVELLDVPIASVEIYVTSKEVAGHSIGELAARTSESHGLFVRAIKRGEQSLPVAPGTVLARGDVITITGPESSVERITPRVGAVIRPSIDTDLGTLGLAICAGIILGIVVSVPIAGLHIALGTSVGTLIAGLAVGWLRSTRPTLGRFPDAAIMLMRSLGLAAFVAMIGLKAGPIFVEAVREVGFTLLLGGVVVTLVPMLVGLYFGRYVLKLDPLLLLGGLAGAQTMTPALAAVQEQSDSPVAVLGYSGTVAFGHVLLTTWGSVIVALMT